MKIYYPLNNFPKKATLNFKACKSNHLTHLSFGQTQVLEKNLKNAQEAFNYVKKLNLRSNTKMEIEGNDRGDQRDDYEDAVSNIRGMNFSRQNQSIDKFIEITKNLAPSLRSGNCSEQSILAATYLHDKLNIDNFALIAAIEVNDKEQFLKKPISYGYNARNHVFLVLGLDSNAKLNNPESWGDNAVIIDPWNNIIGPVNNKDNSRPGCIDQIKQSRCFYNSKKVEFINYAIYIDPTKDKQSAYNWENYQRNVLLENSSQISPELLKVNYIPFLAKSKGCSAKNPV